MWFVRMLGMANFEPEQLDSKSEVVIDKDGDGFAITSVHLPSLPRCRVSTTPIPDPRDESKIPVSGFKAHEHEHQL
jgi:hypothetical protein